MPNCKRKTRKMMSCLRSKTKIFFFQQCLEPETPTAPCYITSTGLPTTQRALSSADAPLHSSQNPTAKTRDINRGSTEKWSASHRLTRFVSPFRGPMLAQHRLSTPAHTGIACDQGRQEKRTRREGERDTETERSKKIGRQR